MGTAQLRREISRLRERGRSRRRDIPADRVVFARELGIEPDRWQRELLRSSSGRVLLNCSRQSGKSTVSAILALHRALYHPGSLVLILAPSERQAKETFGKVARFYRELHEAPVPESDRKLGMLLGNSSRVEALPGSERTVRGFSGVDLLILDEAARVDDALFYSIKPMLAVGGGALLMLSTPWGRRGVFFEEWTRRPGTGWERFEIKASECPRISFEFLEEERRSLPARVFRQEYECSFEDVEDQIFAYELVDQASPPKRPRCSETTRRVGWPTGRRKRRRCLGQMTVASRYFVGLDLGQRHDYTAIVVAEKVELLGSDDYELHVRHLERYRDVLYPEVVERVKRLMDVPKLRGEAALAVDSTGVGAAVTDMLRRAGLAFDAVTIHGGDTETLSGYGSWRVPKRDLVGSLQVLLQSGGLKIVRELEHAETLKAELLNFRVKINIATGHDSYEAWREGDHDDLVLAAAMATWKAQKPEFAVLIGRE